MLCKNESIIDHASRQAGAHSNCGCGPLEPHTKAAASRTSELHHEPILNRWRLNLQSAPEPKEGFMRKCIVAGVGVLWLLALPAGAADQRIWDDCKGGDFERSIVGCT